MDDFQQRTLVRQAQQQLDAGRYMDCRSTCERLLKLRRNHPEAMLLLAQIDYREGRPDDVVNRMQRYVRQHPKDPGGRDFFGWILTELGRYREAVQQYDRALKLVPRDPDALAGKARALDRQGKSEQGIALLEPAVTSGRATPEMALIHATCLMNLKEHQRAIDVAAPAASAAHDDRATIAGLYFLLGQCHERLDEIDKAFDAYSNANRVHPRSFDPEHFDRRIDALIDVFSRRNLDRLPRAENASEQPVFIACQPRSGSTLVERIIASHPKAAAGGELTTLNLITRSMQLEIGSTEGYPHCALDLDQDDVNTLSRRYFDDLRRISKNAARITNKDLFLWEQLGLMELLCPNGRIIDLRREAVDHSIACYFIDLGPKFPYACDLEHIARVCRAYERLMDHWHEVLSLPILTVNYEDIVADQEAASRRVIEFLGLEWNESVLEFHGLDKKTLTAIPTLSYAQVRQPIYTTSVGRAHKFRQYIGPLLEALGERTVQ